MKPFSCCPHHASTLKTSLRTCFWSSDFAVAATIVPLTLQTSARVPTFVWPPPQKLVWGFSFRVPTFVWLLPYPPTSKLSTRAHFWVPTSVGPPLSCPHPKNKPSHLFLGFLPLSGHHHYVTILRTSSHARFRGSALRLATTTTPPPRKRAIALVLGFLPLSGHHHCTCHLENKHEGSLFGFLPSSGHHHTPTSKTSTRACFWSF